MLVDSSFGVNLVWRASKRRSSAGFPTTINGSRTKRWDIKPHGNVTGPRSFRDGGKQREPDQGEQPDRSEKHGGTMGGGEAGGLAAQGASLQQLRQAWGLPAAL